jgi:DNA-directed RNA polymerase specialized sigma24 family protein
MEHDPAVTGLESFLARRGEPLLRTAMLLTGTKEAGEDLLQAGLERLLRHWHRDSRSRRTGISRSAGSRPGPWRRPGP